MGREYKIDIVVDEHGAEETFKRVDAAGDQMATRLEQGAGKVVQFGQAVKQSAVEPLEKFVVTEVEADRYLSEFHTSLSKMPSTFQVLRGGVNEFANSLGVTVESLGALYAGGLILATASSAWGLGRLIANFFDLDTTIGNATAKLLGFGDVAGETAAAKADVLARASANAGFQVTSYTAAIQINAEAQAKWQAAAKNADDAIQRMKGPETSRLQLALWENEIGKVADAGALRGLTRDIESHAFSHQELAKNYRISTEAVALYTQQLREEGEEEKRFLADIKHASDERAKAVRAEQQIEEEVTKQFGHTLADRAKFLDESLANTLKYYDALKNAQLKTINDIVVANLQAKIALNAGMGADANGQPKTTDPFADYQKQVEDIHRNAPEGIDTRALEEKAFRDFQDKVNGAAAAADKMAGSTDRASVASDKSASSSDGLRGGFDRAGSASYSLSSAFGQAASMFSGLSPSQFFNQNLTPQYGASGFVGYGPTGMPHMAEGGPVGRDGPIFAHAGEFVVPREGMLVRGSSSSSVVIHIDAKGATFEDERALDRLVDKITSRFGQRLEQQGRF